MSDSLPLVELREVLRPITRPEPVEPERLYRLLGAHWYAGGLYVKDIKPGSQIQANQLYRVERGDFVYNRLFAWKGSFAIATEDHHGCYVSNEFPCFAINTERIEPRYLGRYFSRASVWEDALGLSSGGTPTSRNRLKEARLLSMFIPLLPLDEQRRIVTRIEELAAKIEEARGLRRQAVAEAEALVNACARTILAAVNADVTELRCWLDQDRDGIQTGPFGSQLGSHDFVDSGVPVLTIGNVQYGGLILDGLKCVPIDKARQLNRFAIKEGDILFARMGTVGRCCVVPTEAEGWLINYHIIRVALDRSRVEPRYVHWIIRASLPDTFCRLNDNMESDRN
jgi:type I restriction enzyme S subunit